MTIITIFSDGGRQPFAAMIGTGKCTLDFNLAHGYFEDAEVVPMSAKKSTAIDQMLAL